MTVHYLDTSAWAKRYSEEVGSDWMAILFAREEAFACASLGLIEMVAAFARKRKAGLVDDAQLDDALQGAERDWRGFLDTALGREVQALAIGVARRHALRGADAVHLASALYVRQRLSPEEVTMVTSDGEMKTAALAEGFVVLDPAEEQRVAR